MTRISQEEADEEDQRQQTEHQHLDADTHAQNDQVRQFSEGDTSQKVTGGDGVGAGLHVAVPSLAPLPVYC
jgi:hypothetical protein